MTILIRQAFPEDATYIAPLIYNAIADIANRLTGEHNEADILATLEYLVTQRNNRHSYLNTYVAFRDEEILGIVVLYDGLQGKAFDKKLQDWLMRKNVAAITIDVEAYDDEYYIDTVCVTETARGLGIGTQLLAFAEETARAKGYKKLSLNVEPEKDKARRLYERIGFAVTEPWTIINEPFYHMVKQLEL
ncbi:GNAT family N-acetyltransferase [Solibacillus sp. FSL H8-0538]|uniref:GNAT family N-acetyltransferase n=1 Tax=Solibacillus sp. FSL H8-0538 TaxID=2921400 RepID=UPI0030FBB669